MELKIKKRKVFIDLDDTIAHFTRHFMRSIHKYPEFNPWPQSRPGFFAELEPIEGAKEGIYLLQQYFDVWILTKPSYMNPHCYTDKRLWLEEHYGLDFCQKLILCPDKGLIDGKDSYLIDDMDWKGFSGTQLHFGTGDLQTWPDVIKRLMDLETTKLYRPVNQHELKLIEEDYRFGGFPPRKPEQPFFYPVTNREYATQITKEWNVPAYGEGYVLEFRVLNAFLDQFDVKTVGGQQHTEYWIPREKLNEFNQYIYEPIKIVDKF